MMYNPNHPVHCPCPQCSWWSLGYGPESLRECEVSFFYPLQSRLFTPASAATQSWINLDVCSPRLWFCFIGNSKYRIARSASRNLAPQAQHSGLEGWV